MNAMNDNPATHRWGPFSALVVAVAVVMAGGVVNFALLSVWPDANRGQRFVLGFGFLLTMLLVIPLADLRRGGVGLADFFALRAPQWRPALVATGLFVAYLGGLEMVFRLIDRKAGMETMRDIWLICPTAGLWRAGFIVNVLVLAPVCEEVLFRGFLLEGLRTPFAGRDDGWLGLSWGEWGAVSLSAGLWAGLHGQYEAPELVALFIMGLALGAIRLRTRSLYLPIALHAVTNLVALVQLMVG